MAPSPHRSDGGNFAQRRALINASINAPVTASAHQVGDATPSAFSYAFRCALGERPSASFRGATSPSSPGDENSLDLHTV